LLNQKINISKEFIEQEERIKELSKKNKKKNNNNKGNLLGILSIVFGILGLLNFGFGFLFGVFGITCGFLGMSRDENGTVSIIGTILSFISIILSMLIYFGFKSLFS
jgi:hypothetical protein